MSKSTEELLRELEAGGILEGSPARPPVAVERKPPKPGTALRERATGSGLVMLVVAEVLVAAIGSLPFGSLALYPFSLFVTLLHETGHALAAIVSGGSVQSISVSGDLSGLTVTAGGIAGVIAPAGYLGATLAGVALLLTPLRYARWALGLLAAVPLATLLLFHPASWFTAVWCLVFLAALGAAAWKLPLRWAAFLQIFMGVQAGLNAFRDLMTLFFISSTDSHIQTDATNMSNALFLPPIFWAVLWTVLSVLLLAGALVKIVRRDLPSLRGSGEGAMK